MADLEDIARILVTQDTRGLTRVGFGTPLLVGYHTAFSERAKVYTRVSDMKLDGFKDAADYPDSNATLANVALVGPQPSSFDFASAGLPQTFDVAVNGLSYTVDFNATGAEATSQAAPGGVFDFSVASTMTVQINGVANVVSFNPGDFVTPAAVPPSEAAAVLDASLQAAGFTGAEYIVTVPAGSNAVRITTTTLGTDAELRFVAGFGANANDIFVFPTPAARLTSQNAPGGTFDFSIPRTMTVDIDGAANLVSFAPGDFVAPAAVPPAEMATVLDTALQAAGFVGTEYVVTVPPGTSAVRITTTSLAGPASTLQITAGAPDDANAILGFPVTQQQGDEDPSGAGDFADASAATVAEVVAEISGDLTSGGATSFLVSSAGDVITISTVNVGPTASLQVTEPANDNANALLGFPTQLIQGSAGNGDIDDPLLTAARAVFAQSPRVERVIVGRSDAKPAANFQMTPVVKNRHQYSLEVNGENFTYVSDAGATASEIADGMAQAISLGVAARNGVVSVVSAAGAITLTAPGSVSGAMELYGSPNDWDRADQSVDPGTLAEVTAIQLENDDWYGLFPTFQGKAEMAALAAGLGGLGAKLMGFASADTAILSGPYIAGSGSDIASDLRDLGTLRTFVAYHSRPHTQFAAGWAGVMLPKAPGSATWHLKTVQGVPISQLNANQQANVQSKNANHYQALAGGNVTQNGITSGGDFMDTTRFTDWVRQRLREDIFATLSGVDKVPYTDEGGAVAENIVWGVIREGISVGGFAANPEPVVTVPLVADQNPVDRANRFFPGVEASATLAGAIHRVEVEIVVSV